jgi:hypothetical protein
MFCLIRVGTSARQNPRDPRTNEEDRASYHARLDRADAAGDREMAREKAGDCEEAGTKGQQP